MCKPNATLEGVAAVLFSLHHEEKYSGYRQLPDILGLPPVADPWSRETGYDNLRG